MTDDPRNDRRDDRRDEPGRPVASGRDQADIAQLLRALNDDLADDAPPPAFRAGPAADSAPRRSVDSRSIDLRRPVEVEPRREMPPPSFAAAARPDDDFDDYAPRRHAANQRPESQRPEDQRPDAYPSGAFVDRGGGQDVRGRRGGVSRRPSALFVAVAIIAAAGVGLGSFWLAPSSSRRGSAGGDAPPPLIERAAPDASAPSRAASDSAPPPPVVMSPSQIPPSSLGTSPRLLTPGQTATVVRPAPDPATDDSPAATVVVQPSTLPSSAPPSSNPQSVPNMLTAPAAAPPIIPRPVAAAKPPPPPRVQPAAPAPAVAPAPAAPAGHVGGPGRWAIQVGTFSVIGNADILAKKLTQGGMHAYVVDWKDRQGRDWKAVRVGNFAAEAAARAAVNDLKNQLNLSGQLIDLR